MCLLVNNNIHSAHCTVSHHYFTEIEIQSGIKTRFIFISYGLFRGSLLNIRFTKITFSKF